MSACFAGLIYADFNSGGTPGHGPCWCLRYGPERRFLDEVAEQLGLQPGMVVTCFTRYDSGLVAHTYKRPFPAIDESHAHLLYRALSPREATEYQRAPGEHVRYDANGNVTSRQGSSITWNSYNYPNQINSGSGASAEWFIFSYSPDRQVWHQHRSGVEDTFYAGDGLFEMAVGTTLQDFRHYIYAGSQLVTVYSRKTNGVYNVTYVLPDHQGSLSGLTDNSGTRRDQRELHRLRHGAKCDYLVRSCQQHRLGNRRRADRGRLYRAEQTGILVGPQPYAGSRFPNTEGSPGLPLRYLR